MTIGHNSIQGEDKNLQYYTIPEEVCKANNPSQLRINGRNYNGFTGNVKGNSVQDCKKDQGGDEEH